MWSWLVLSLIIITCMLCFISVVQLEMKKSSARVWLVLACCSIVATVWVVFNRPSLDMREYHYQPNSPNIVLKELEPPPEQVNLSEPAPSVEPEETPKPAGTEEKAVVVINELNIRDDANTSAPVLDKVTHGEIVTVVEEQAGTGWVKIKTSTGLTGWVDKRYLNILPVEQNSQKPEIKLGR